MNRKTRWLVFSLTIGLLVGAAVASAAPLRRLTTTLGESTGVELAVAGNVVHAVWYDDTTGPWEVYYRKSDNGGLNWGARQQLTEGDGSFHPAIAAAGPVVHVVWGSTGFGKNIFYKRSTDGGDSWSSTMALTTDGVNAASVAVAAEGSEVHVVWTDTPGGDHVLFYLRSNDAGETWFPRRRLRTLEGLVVFPSIAMAGREVHVVWEDNGPGQIEIMYRRSRDGGTSWRRSRVSFNIGEAEFPRVAASGGTAAIVWHDDRSGRPKAYLRRSLDAGSSWSATEPLRPAEVWEALPAIAVSGSEMHALWAGTRNGVFGIYFQTSADGGASWSGPARLTRSRRHAEFPVLATQGSVVHAAWAGIAHGGRKQIFYKRIE